MTDTKKMTKREVINLMLGESFIQSNETYVEYLTHELELLDRKNSSKGATKVQVENEKVMDTIYNELKAIGRPCTISELMEESEVIKNYTLENGNSLTNQKISALLKKLVDTEKVTKVTEKKKSYFSVN